MGLIDKNKINSNSDVLEIGDYDFDLNIDKKLRVVFMGTPSFAVPILEGLIDNYDVELVVCQPDRKKDRRGNVIIPDTKKVAIDNGIEVFQPTNIREDYDKIIEKNPDLIVTCAYGQIIPDSLINYPKYGAINVHGSLLPKLRGGAPIHHAIINGDKETGVTVMTMASRMDAGDIISKRKIKIEDSYNLDILYDKMSYLGRDLLLDTIPSIIDGTAIYTKQIEDEVTFGFNITKEEEKIDFNKSVIEIRNRVRGLSSVPGAYCYLDGKRFKIYLCEIVNKKVDDKYSNGEIVSYDKTSITVKCCDGYLKVLDIAIEGKKRCMMSEYLNGVKGENLVGKVFM